jgi:hypothetical protein
VQFVNAQPAPVHNSKVSFVQLVHAEPVTSLLPCLLACCPTWSGQGGALLWAYAGWLDLRVLRPCVGACLRSRFSVQAPPTEARASVGCK